MLDRVELGLVAEMPLAGKVRRVAVLLIELGDGRCLFLEAIGVAGNDDNRHRRTDRDTPGHERCAARGAAGLAVPIGEHGTFLGEAINVRRRVAEAAPPRGPKSAHPASSHINMTTLGRFFCCAKACELAVARARKFYKQTKQGLSCSEFADDCGFHTPTPLMIAGGGI